MDSAHEMFWRLHGKDIGEDGEPLFPGVAECLGEIDALRRSVSETVEVLNWFVNLCHGTSKGGHHGSPAESEWQDAIASAERILKGDHRE